MVKGKLEAYELEEITDKILYFPTLNVAGKAYRAQFGTNWGDTDFPEVWPLPEGSVPAEGADDAEDAGDVGDVGDAGDVGDVGERAEEAGERAEEAGEEFEPAPVVAADEELPRM